MKRGLVYSGPKSVKFWKRVNSFKGIKHDILYSLGCILQNIECQVLTMMDNWEKK